MKQLILGKTYSSIGNQSDYPVYAPLRGTQWEQGGFPHEKFAFSHPWSVAGSFKNLYVEIMHPSENPAGNGWPAIDFTLYVNDVPSDLVVTVPAHADVPSPTPGNFSTSATNIADTVSVMPGDRLALGRGVGTIAPGFNQFSVMIAWSMTFESTNDGESGYGTSSCFQGAIAATNDFYVAPLNGAGGFSGGTDNLNHPDLHSVIPLIGSLFRYDVQIDTAPGAGSQRVFCLQLNGVKQDGAGGTVNTTLTLGAADLEGTATFDLPVAVLDWVSLVQLQATGPAPAAALLTSSIGLRAVTDGQSALCFNTGGPTSDGSTDFSTGAVGAWASSTAIAPTPTTQPLRWPMTELSMSMPGPLDAFTFSSLCVNFGTFPGTDNSYSLTTRVAFADTSAVALIGDSDLLVEGSGTTDVLDSPTDRLDLQAIALSTPSTSSVVGWTWLVTESEAPPIVTTSYPIRRLRRFALPFAQNKWIRLSRVELIMQAGNGLSGTAATVQGYNPIVMFRLSRDGGATWDDELQMATGKIGEYTARAYLNRLGRARNPVVELTSSDPVFVSWIDFTVDYDEGTS